MCPLSTPKPCAQVGCPKTTRETYCPEHKKAKEDWRPSNENVYGKRTKRERNPIYATARWQRLRLMMLRRFPICQAENCRNPSLEIDHVVSLRLGGAPFDMENLQCLCTSCHARKTLKETRQNNLSK